MEKAKENSVTTCKTNCPASKERELVNSETGLHNLKRMIQEGTTFDHDFMLLLVNNVVQKMRTQVTNTISLY